MTGSVHVVLILDIDEEFFDVVAVAATDGAAYAAATAAARDAQCTIDRWVTVDRTPDQTFTDAIESHPQNGVYFRIEHHPVIG